MEKAVDGEADRSNNRRFLPGHKLADPGNAGARINVAALAKRKAKELGIDLGEQAPRGTKPSRLSPCKLNSERGQGNPRRPPQPLLYLASDRGCIVGVINSPVRDRQTRL